MSQDNISSEARRYIADTLDVYRKHLNFLKEENLTSETKKIAEKVIEEFEALQKYIGK